MTTRKTVGSELSEILQFLRGSRAIQNKVVVSRAYRRAVPLAGPTIVGDDCAAIPQSDGSFLLLAAEGLLVDFVAEDPWFAGYSAVMVNISDVCAMGGEPLAVVDVIWTPDDSGSDLVWDGMEAASRAYGVPIVGGHTTITHDHEAAHLAACIVGRARSLITSFDACPGDDLLMVVDLRGSFRRDKPFWNASVGTDPRQLQKQNRLLPELADSGWCHAGKDISNGGIIGTLVMLLECSRVGAWIDLDRLPRPASSQLSKWLVSFPSYGFVLSIPPGFTQQVLDHFRGSGVSCSRIGSIIDDPKLEIRQGGRSEVFWSPAEVDDA